MNENSVVNVEPAEKLVFSFEKEQPQIPVGNKDAEDYVYRMFRQPYI